MASRRIVKPAADPAAESPEKAARRRVAARELERRRRLPRAIEALIATLHPKQRAFVTSPAKRMATCAGRRSGKTYALVALALTAAARDEFGGVGDFGVERAVAEALAKAGIPT